LGTLELKVSLCIDTRSIHMVGVGVFFSVSSSVFSSLSLVGGCDRYATINTLGKRVIFFGVGHGKERVDTEERGWGEKIQPRFLSFL